MNHPNTPCPEHLKPVFTKVLAAIKAMLAGEAPPEGIQAQSCENKYICFVLGDMAAANLITREEYIEATDFVEDCLRVGFSANPSFGEWCQHKHDHIAADNRIVDICNAGRVAWLGFLTT